MEEVLPSYHVRPLTESVDSKRKRACYHVLLSGIRLRRDNATVSVCNNHIQKHVEINELGLLENPRRSLDYLQELEELGEDILRDRLEIISLDKRRNHNREAIRALTSHHSVSPGKTWITLGSLLVKMPSSKAIEILQREQVTLDVEINKLRSELKVKVNKLRDAEHMPAVPGLHLNPVSREEMNALGQVLGWHST